VKLWRPYGEQTRGGLQVIVNGVVQPDVLMAVKAKTRQRTTLYLRPNMTTPSVAKSKPRSVMLRGGCAETVGFSKIQDY
jgi:hypothetical protein